MIRSRVFFLLNKKRGRRAEGGKQRNGQQIGADCAAENAMIKQLTGTDQSIGRC